jgi:hypothetical protein
VEAMLKTAKLGESGDLSCACVSVGCGVVDGVR